MTTLHCFVPPLQFARSGNAYKNRAIVSLLLATSPRTHTQSTMAIQLPSNVAEVRRVYADCTHVFVRDAVMTHMRMPDDVALRRIGLYHVFARAMTVVDKASEVLTAAGLPPGSVRCRDGVVVVGDYAELYRGNVRRWTGIADDETVSDMLRDAMRATREQLSVAFQDANVRLLPWALCVVHETCADPLYAERTSANEPALQVEPPASPELPVDVVPPQPVGQSAAVEALTEPVAELPLTQTDLAVIHDRWTKLSTTARNVKVDNMGSWFATPIVTVDTRQVTEAGWPHAQFVSVHHVLLLLVPEAERAQRTRQFVSLVRYGVVNVFRFSARHLRRVARSGDAVSRAYQQQLMFVDVRDLTLMIDDGTQGRPEWGGRMRVPDDVEVAFANTSVRYSPDVTEPVPCLVYGDVHIVPLNLLMASSARRHVEREACTYTVPAAVGARLAARLREHGRDGVAHKLEHGFYGMDARDLFSHERAE